MIQEKLTQMQTEYLKSKDLPRLGVLRFFLSQIKYKEIELRPQKQEVTDEIVFKVLKKLIKQRNEAIELATKAGRPEAVTEESSQLDILKEFVKLFPEDLQAQL